MANSLTDISSYYNNMYGGTVWPVPLQIKRSNGLPLDQSTIFQTLKAAQDYASGQNISSYSPDGTLLVQQAAYRGQFIAVVPISGNAETSGFVVNEKGELTYLASGKNLESLSSAVYENLSTIVEKLSVPQSGYSASYVIKQGGLSVGELINIPQDKVIKSAYVVYVSAETDALTSFVVDHDNGEIRKRIISGATEADYKLYQWDGTQWVEDTTTTQISARFNAIHSAYSLSTTGGEGSYIRMEIAGTEGTIDTPVVYVPVPGLANSYVGASTETISVAVEEGRSEQHKISAIVRDSSIGSKHLTTELSDAIHNAMHYRGIGEFDDTLKEGATWAQTSATLSSVNWYKTHAAIDGDFIIKVPSESEYVFTELCGWKEFGDGSFKQAVEISVNNLCVALQGETARAKDAEQALSTDTSNKVQVGTGKWNDTSASYSLVNQTSLSVIKIGDEDYYKMVAAGQNLSDALYIVSSDYVNGHGQRIINVGTPLSATDAVNLSTLELSVSSIQQQQTEKEVLSVKINNTVFELQKASNIATLSIECINCGDAN